MQNYTKLRDFKWPGQPPARVAFTDLPGVLAQLGQAPVASALIGVMSDMDVSKPSARTVQQVVYKGALIKHATAFSLLNTLRLYAEKHQLAVDDKLFDPNAALIEFDTALPGLWRALSQSRHHDNANDADLVDDIAVRSGVHRDVILAATNSRYSLLTRRVAERIAVAASATLGLAEPLQTKTFSPNETKFRPIASKEAYLGKYPLDDQTLAIRESVIAATRKMAA